MLQHIMVVLLVSTETACISWTVMVYGWRRQRRRGVRYPLLYDEVYYIRRKRIILRTYSLVGRVRRAEISGIFSPPSLAREANRSPQFGINRGPQFEQFNG